MNSNVPESTNQAKGFGIASPFSKISRTHLMLSLLVWFVLGLGLFALFRGGKANYLLFGSDLYPRWIGARAFWQGASPYAPQVQLEAEQLIYGRARLPGEVTYLFQYPAHLAIVLAPFLLVPLEWVGVVWCGLLTAILLTIITVWSWELTPRLVPLSWGIVLFTGILFFPAQSGILSGQYPLFILACGLGAIWLIASQRDGWAGALVACATVKPSIGLFLPIALCLWALRWKRYRIVSGFIITLALMLLLTFARIGWWVPDFLNQSRVYENINQAIDLAWSPQEILTAPGILWLASACALLGIGLVEAWREPRFPWLALFGVMSANMILTPHSLEYDLTMFLLVLLWLGWQWREQRWGIWAWVILMWTPWLVWIVLRLAGLAVPDVWKALWQSYPLLLNTVVLWWWASENRKTICKTLWIRWQTSFRDR